MKKIILSILLLAHGLAAPAQQWSSHTNFNRALRLAYQPGGGIIWGATPGGVFAFSAADTVLLRHYTNLDGLPYIETSSIITDQYQNKWIGTLGGGLARLDSAGAAWTVFTSADGLASDTVLCAAADGPYLYAGGCGTLSCYDGGSWLPALRTSQGYRLGERTQALAFRNDSLWIATDQGLSVVRAGTPASLRDTANWETFAGYDGLSPDIRCLLLTDTLSVMGAADGAARLGPAGTWQRIPGLSGQVRDLALAGDSLLLATDHGVMLWRQGVLSGLSPGLTASDILSLTVDGGGRAWAGSDSGLARLQDGQWQERSFPGPKSNYLSRVALSPEGAVWMAHQSTHLSRWADGQWTAFTLPFPDIPFKTLGLDRDGQAWIGLTWGSHFLKLLDDDSLAVIDSCVPLGANIWASYLDGPDGKYFSAYNQSVLRLAPGDSVWTTYTDPAPRGAYNNAMWIISIARDPWGGLWLGSYYNDLTRFDPRSGRWEHFGAESGIPDVNIRQIAVDRSGALWLATGNGLCRAQYHPASGTLTSTVYQTGNSPIAGNDIRSVAVDRSDNKWIGTDGGLSLLAWDGRWQSYRRGDSPLLSNDILQVAAGPYDRAGDRICIATSRGLSLLRHDDLVLRTARPAQVAPNPFNPARDDYLYFSNLPSEARVDIYTLDGRSCGTFYGPAAPAHTLAVRPDADFARPPVSGLYLCRIGSAQGGTAICKLVIVR